MTEVSAVENQGLCGWQRDQCLNEDGKEGRSKMIAFCSLLGKMDDDDREVGAGFWLCPNS